MRDLLQLFALLFLLPFAVLYYGDEPGSHIEAVCTVHNVTEFKYGTTVLRRVQYDVCPLDTSIEPFVLPHVYRSTRDHPRDHLKEFNCTTSKNQIHRSRHFYRGNKRIQYAATNAIVFGGGFVAFAVVFYLWVQCACPNFSY